MTKILPALILLFALSGCGQSVLHSESRKEFNAWAKSMKRPHLTGECQAIAAWMKLHMQYESDGLLDYFKPVLQTWWRRGDCEDFARVACEALHHNDHSQFYLLSVFWPGNGHTVCTDGFRHLGNWGYFDGFNGNESLADSISGGKWNRFIVRDLKLRKMEDVWR